MSDEIPIIELTFIDKPPVFNSTLDSLLIEDMSKKRPDIAHILKRLSEETQYRTWSVDRIVALTNFALRSAQMAEKNLEAIEKANALMEQIIARLDRMEERQAEDGKMTRENNETIKEWKTMAKHPKAILVFLVGVTITALVGAWMSTFFSTKP